MRNILMKASAKINLTLDVLGRRPDGYHEISSVMQAIDLHDTLLIEKTGRRGIQLKCDYPGLPVDDQNLVYKAAQLLAPEQGIYIELQKKIPVAAGLAGGSSDCAATLLGLNTLLKLGIPPDQLLKMGRGLGADVPFCIMGGTALAEGIGDRLTALPCHPDSWIVLAHLPIFVSTKEIFSEWSGKSGNMTPAMVKSVSMGNLKKIYTNLSNDLAPIAISMHPEIDSIISLFRLQNALGVNMTGSGPTVFAYFHTKTSALAAMDNIQKQFPNCDMFCTQLSAAEGFSGCGHEMREDEQFCYKKP